MARFKLKSTFKKLGIAIAVRTALEKEIPFWKKEVESWARHATASWDTKIRFKTTAKVSGKNINISSKPVGKNKRIWDFVSKGTKPHIIRAKPGKTLAFQTNYKPHTRPGGFLMGPGVATGKTVFAKEVHHPGTKPRNLERQWNKWIRTWFPKAVSETIKKALR